MLTRFCFPELESGLASHDEKGLATALTTALASKQYGAHEQLAKLVAKAAQVVMPSNPALFNVDAIRVVKVLGSSLNNSSVIKGMVFPRAPESTTKSATKAKVAIFSSGIDVAHTETKGTVLLKNADELLGFSKGEEEHLEKIINEIAATGVKCIIAGNQVGELALHYLNRHGIVVLKVLSKFDLRRLANVVGATPLTRMGPPMPEEMGFVDVVESVEIGGDRVTVLRQDDEATKTATIVVRGATTSQMDDIERAIDDGVNSIKALLRDPRFVPGAGATELEIAKQVAEYGEKTPGLSQHGIRKFAESLEVVPRTLAENAGLDATEVLANLYAAHQSGDKAAGVDIDSENSNGVLNAQKHGILDLMVVTEWAMRYATQAALTVLQVDAIIMSKVRRNRSRLFKLRLTEHFCYRRPASQGQNRIPTGTRTNGQATIGNVKGHIELETTQKHRPSSDASFISCLCPYLYRRSLFTTRPASISNKESTLDGVSSSG